MLDGGNAPRRTPTSSSTRPRKPSRRTLFDATGVRGGGEGKRHSSLSDDERTAEGRNNGVSFDSDITAAAASNAYASDDDNDYDDDDDDLEAAEEEEQQRRRLLMGGLPFGTTTAAEPSSASSSSPLPPPTQAMAPLSLSPTNVTLSATSSSSSCDIREFLANALFAALRLLRLEQEAPCQRGGGFIGRSSSHLPRIGQLRVFAPQTWRRTGWGVLGPHWFGPLFVLLLDAFAGTFFAQMAWDGVGPITATMCGAFTLVIAMLLCDTAYRDPGAVTSDRYQHYQRKAAIETAQAQNEDDDEVVAEDGHFRNVNPFADPDRVLHRQSPSRLSRRRRPRHRWCESCRAYCPDGAAHCYDCDMCIAGYDHHCVWMGTCVGEGNAKAFVRFNLSWLLFLGYALVWVNWLGPSRTAKSEASP